MPPFLGRSREYSLSVTKIRRSILSSARLGRRGGAMHSSTGGLGRSMVRPALCGLLLAVIAASTTPMATAGSFQPVGSMTEALYDPVVVTLADGSALVIGGWKHVGDQTYGTATVQRFDPTTNQFTNVGPMS